MIHELGEKGITYLFKAIVLLLFGWLLRDSYRRPTREEVSQEIDNKIGAQKEVTNEKITNIKEDVTEIKCDVKQLLMRKER